MVSDRVSGEYSGNIHVLILVLMEDGLGLLPPSGGEISIQVLILVLMEDGLGPINGWETVEYVS